MFQGFALPIAVLLPFAGAILAAAVCRWHRVAAAWAAGAVTLASLLLLVPVIQQVLAGETVVQAWTWLPAVGLAFAFRMDGLGMLFAVLILLMGLLIILYARYYLTAKDSMGRFFAYLLAFMGSMLGVVLSENLLQLLVFWEMTSLSSFLLISYWQHREDARKGARMALAITGTGGLALLAGILLLGQMVGSYDLSVVLLAGEQVRNHPLYVPMLVLVLLGVFTKSAQFPFHFWLPNAMAAPTPVSAYLHSATMVKAGIFLLARLFPVLAGTPEWSWLVGTAGMLTLLLGALVALFQHDLKGLLAYSTISHLGLITLLFGMGTPLAAVAALFHIINHATFKASLFMVAGIIDHETGTRDMRRLNGLLKYMPHTAVLAMIASSAMAGVPLLNGFLSKEMFFTQTVAMAEQAHFWVLPALATLAGIFSVAYSLRFIHDVFFNGEPVNLPKKPHEPPRFMRIPVDVLVVLCVLVGVFPSVFVAPLLDVAVRGTLQAEPPYYSLALWHGVNAPLLMSLAALLGGVLVYAMRQPLFRWYEAHPQYWQLRRLYDWKVDRLVEVARWVTRWMAQGSLQAMLFWLLSLTLVAGVGGFILGGTPLLGERGLLPLDAVSVAGAVTLILATLLSVVLHRERLLALIVLGAVGLVVSLAFVQFSAPDLALTQLSVEIVTVVLLMLALYFLPQTSPRISAAWRHWRDGMLAVCLGLGAAVLTLAVLTRDTANFADYFISQSVPGGGGTNVVNVILVDFRGFDTLGEITVLALAGLGIFALLQQLKVDAPATDGAGRAWAADTHPLLLQTFSRVLFPLMWLVAAFIFLRGHNLPGGGFIAGLIAALAVVLQYMANGMAWTTQRWRTDMHTWLGGGLMLATVTGLASMVFAYPFLTSAHVHLHLPLVGDVGLASAMFFDAGVFLVVVGATVLALVELGKLSRAANVTRTGGQ